MNFFKWQLICPRARKRFFKATIKRSWNAELHHCLNVDKGSLVKWPLKRTCETTWLSNLRARMKFPTATVKEISSECGTTRPLKRTLKNTYVRGCLTAVQEWTFVKPLLKRTLLNAELCDCLMIELERTFLMRPLKRTLRNAELRHCLIVELEWTSVTRPIKITQSETTWPSNRRPRTNFWKKTVKKNSCKCDCMWLSNRRPRTNFPLKTTLMRNNVTV